jgi:hypothetical protein
MIDRAIKRLVHTKMIKQMIGQTSTEQADDQLTKVQTASPIDWAKLSTRRITLAHPSRYQPSSSAGSTREFDAAVLSFGRFDGHDLMLPLSVIKKDSCYSSKICKMKLKFLFIYNVLAEQRWVYSKGSRSQGGVALAP